MVDGGLAASAGSFAATASDRPAQLLRLIDSIRLVPSDAARDRLLDEIRSVPSPLILAFVNAHAVNTAWSDGDFLGSLAEADLRLRDGSGMAIGLRMLGHDPGLDMNGTDLIPALIRALAPRRAAFFGSELRYAAAAATACEPLGAEPVAIRGGFEPDLVYVDLAARTRPELILLGMGMPKQERVALLMRDALAHRCLIVAGGAILDFLAQRYPRAPLIMRRLGIEWLYRLWLEPRRLSSRYLLGNGVFLWRIALLRSLARQRHGYDATASLRLQRRCTAIVVNESTRTSDRDGPRKSRSQVTAKSWNPPGERDEQSAAESFRVRKRFSLSAAMSSRKADGRAAASSGPAAGAADALELAGGQSRLAERPSTPRRD